jgi:hypothetical protein
MDKVTVVDYIKYALGVNEFTVKRWVSENVGYESVRINKYTPKYILYANVDRVEYKATNGYIYATIWIK